MLTKTQQAIIQFLLQRTGQAFSIRKISRDLHKSYTLVYHNIQTLIRTKVLKVETVPPAHVVRINDCAASHILIDMERQLARRFMDAHPWIELYVSDVLKSAETSFFILLVFGSYATGTEKYNSDIDLLYIAPEELLAPIEHAAAQYTKVKKSILAVSPENLLAMLKNPNALTVGNEARKHHIILHGTEQYYALICKARTE